LGHGKATDFIPAKEGNITSPRVFVSLEKEFGRYLRIEPRAYGEVSIDRFRELWTVDGEL
jgi:hypothetical protein